MAHDSAVLRSGPAPVYGDEVLVVEPYGAEAIPAGERHGRPAGVFTLWVGANVEFATLVTGALTVQLFGLGLGQAALAVGLGNLLGAALLAALATRGPLVGAPQLVQSRGPFGFAGNFGPSALNVLAGVGWFAVNTVLGVFALTWLLHVGFVLSLALVAAAEIVFAVYGHNWIHAFERAMALLLTGVFALVTLYALPHVDLAVGPNPHAALWSGAAGSFILALSVAFSYVLGWTAFASDYTRYLPGDTPARRVFWPAFWGVVLPCVWLEALGAALATLGSVAAPTDLFSRLLPHALGVLAMLAVVFGTIAANVLNLYSGALSLLAIDVRPVRSLFPSRWLAAVVIGLLGTALSLVGQHGYSTSYEDFLLLLGYWVAPWAAVVLADAFLVRRGGRPLGELYDRTRTLGPGFWAWLAGIAASAPFFNQALFVGPLARLWPGLGDVSYYVGFAVAGALYLRLTTRRAGGTQPVAGP